ncbi:uncharacterized protein LOC113496503 [Trichoplusia ni]|uniref:Uncharacterized protein LOC113496503 n=1 Tax=Trichoplusia ni TaxID=7111 RepID=A0A7E5VTS6_TRINI|nr:uncharacterized protein LOC113496503 [Trichoplusia ni]
MASVTLVFFALSCSLASLQAESDGLNSVLFSGNYEFIDMTHPFDNRTVYWPGTEPFKFTKQKEEFDKDNSWYAAYEFSAGEHGGTHLDAPYHFSNTGKRVGDFPIDKLILPLLVVDISEKVNGNSDFVLTKNDLDLNWLNSNTGKPCLLVFNFGWSKYFNDRQKYLGYDEVTKTMRFPGLSTEVAELITSTYKNIVGIGTDVSSVDPGATPDFAVHKQFSKAGLYNIENVNFEKKVPATKCTALALPMKIGMGTGAPLRLVAICPQEAAA